ncbi:MAG: proteasome subunit beta [Nitrospirales bacterium]|nr:proteasome subunit beta [Nitrospirales bacterium]
MLFNHHCSSFLEFLQQEKPELMPAARWAAASVSEGFSAETIRREYLATLAHGTTILALRYHQGVIIAGDRRATEGFQVADRRMEKVYTTDSHSAMAIAGTAGPCMEMAKLFSIELEHYEKVDGIPLSCEGKANRLAHMVKANLPMVLQGLVVVPLFVGYDHKDAQGRMFKYDIAGGRYEETDYHAVGSGGKDARITIKEHFRRNATEQDTIRIALLALLNAADEDVGTGGPDRTRRIYPTMKLVDSEGVRDVEESQVAAICEEIAASRGEDQ